MLTIYKSFICPHLDYGDIVYHQPNNGSLCKKIESMKYQATLAITGTMHWTSKTKLYNELGIESMKLSNGLGTSGFFSKYNLVVCLNI